MSGLNVNIPRFYCLMLHGRNCAAWTNEFGHEVNGSECTCGLRYRIQLQTEQEMHAAWRKRAEESEAREAALESELASLRESTKVLYEAVTNECSVEQINRIMQRQIASREALAAQPKEEN